MKSYPKITTIFADGFSVFAKEWKLLVGLTLIFMLPIYAAIYWTQNTSVGLGLLFILIFFLVAPILQILIAKITESRHKHKKTHPWKELWVFVRKKYLDVLLTMIILGLIALALIIAITIIFAIIAAIVTGATGVTVQTGGQLPPGLIITGIIYGIVLVIAFIVFATCVVFVNPIVVLTKYRYFKAIKESFKLVKKRWLPTFARFLTLEIASLILIYVMLKIFYPIELSLGVTPALRLIKSVVQQIIVLPIGVAGIMWYLRTK